MSLGSDGSVIIDTELDESGLRKGLASLSGTVLNGVTKAVEAAVGAMAALGAYTIKVGSDFEASMSQVGATMGMTVEEIRNGSEEFEALRKAAIEMGSTTAFSCTEAAEALNYMALAGYDAQTSIDMLPNVLSLAAAGALELGYASDMVTDSQTALGLSIDETKVLVDQMAKAASKSNTSVEQLGEAILTVGGTAQYMKGGITELNTVLGVLADNGIKGSEGGTHLRNMLLKLASPTDDAKALIEDLGVEIFDAEGKMRSFAEIFPDLNAAMADFTDEQKIQAFSTLFNTRDVAAANALLGTSVERWEELGAAIEDSAGAAEQMAAVQLDNLQGDLTLLKSASEGFGISLYDNVQAPLRDLVQEGTALIGELNEAVLNNGLSGLAEGLGGALAQAVAKIASYLPQITQGAANLVSGLVRGLTDAAPSIADAATSCISIFTDAFFSITTDLVSLGAELVISLANGIAENASSIIDAFVSGIVNLASTIVNYAPQIVIAGAELVKAVAQGIVNAIPTIIEALPALLDAFISGLMDLYPALFDCVISIVTSLVAALPGIISTIVDVLPTLIEGIINGILSLIPMLIECVLQLALAIVQALPQIISAIVQALPTLIATIVSAIVGCLPQLLKCVLDIVLAIVQYLPQIILNIVGILPTLISSIVAGIIACLPQLLEGAASLVLGIVEALPDIIVSIVQILPTLIESIVLGLLDNIGILIQCVVDMVAAIAKALPQIFLTIVQTLLSLVKALAKSVADLWTNFKEAAKEWITKIWEGISEKWGSLISNIKSFFSQIPSKIKEAIGDIASVGKHLVQGLWNGINNAEEWVLDKIRGFGKSILNGIKSFFGIASPSRVMRDVIGKNLVYGIGNGISEAADYALNSMEDVADDLSNVDFSLPPPEFDDFDIPDYDAMIADAQAAVNHQFSFVGMDIAGTQKSEFERSVDTEDKEEREPIPDQHIEFTIGEDTVARAIAHDVGGYMEWEVL